SKGDFHFSQAVLPSLLKAASWKPEYSPNILFKGAAASLKGSFQTCSFVVGKFATRALAQSLTREFRPEGVHVGHIILDGLVDLPGCREYLKNEGPEARIDPNSIANTYWYLHTQPRSAFTHELQVRPYVERW
ncbi:hypothetical protein P154DRAFT_438541, partial [Amniculicola lignicola CBS 123094]